MSRFQASMQRPLHFKDGRIRHPFSPTVAFAPCAFLFIHLPTPPSVFKILLVPIYFISVFAHLGACTSFPSLCFPSFLERLLITFFSFAHLGACVFVVKSADNEGRLAGGVVQVVQQTCRRGADRR